MKSAISSILILVLFCLSQTGCGNGDVIDMDKMSDIMNDVTLAEAYVESYLMKDTSVKKESLLKSELNKVFYLHEVKPELFYKSYTYYLNRPDEFKVIVDSANERAIRARDRAYNRTVPKAP